MKAQWEADRHAEAERQRSRRSSLLTALHTECTALRAIAASSDADRYSRVPQGLPIWQEHRSTIIGESKTLGDALTLIEQQLRVIQGHLPNVIREGTPDFTGRLANHNAETAINEAFSSIEQLSKHAINDIDRLLSAV